MDDNIWEYPFGDLEDDDEDMVYRNPDLTGGLPHIPDRQPLF